MTLDEIRAAAERVLAADSQDRVSAQDAAALATFVRDLLSRPPSHSVAVMRNMIVLHGGNPWPDSAIAIAAHLLRAAEQARAWRAAEAAEREVG